MTVVTNFDEAACQTAIAEDNLSYLLYASAELKRYCPGKTVRTTKSWEQNSALGTALKALPLLDYSSKYCWQHMANLDEKNRKGPCELALQLMEQERLYRWAMFFELFGHECRYLKEGEAMTPLYMASLTGCTALVAELIGQGADLSAGSGVYSTPLQAAIAKNHLIVVQMLLDARLRSPLPRLPSPCRRQARD